jgi:UbiD family decarboxylase
MHWQIGKGGGFHHHLARERGEDLPVTLFVGGPPALIVSAIAPLPENVPELLLASLLLGERLRMREEPRRPAPAVARLRVRARGPRAPNEMAPEGPFGDHYGYYS